jgi:hypothetical protein
VVDGAAQREATDRAGAGDDRRSTSQRRVVLESEDDVLMANNAERAAEQRKVKLEEMDRQIKQGTLKVRKMTVAERKLNPPKPRPERRGYR